MIRPLESRVIRPGSGESTCRTPAHIRVALTNQPISRQEIRLFAAFIDYEFDVSFKKVGQNNYGTAYPTQNRINLNRCCVGTFLHELAHLIAFKCKAYGHDEMFGRILDGLYVKWTEFEERLIS